MLAARRRRFQMTMEEQHAHSVLLDVRGNGTSTNNSNHVHEVRNWTVQPAGDKPHKHTVMRD